MTARPDVIPLYPRRGDAEEARSWASVFHYIADRPPDNWRTDPRARALIAAADHFLGVGPTSKRRPSRRAR
jgi:hypothetical protein